jgi:hypothetical protein
LIPKHHIHSLLNNLCHSIIYLWVLWRHICWLIPRMVKWNLHMYAHRSILKSGE